MIMKRLGKFFASIKALFTKNEKMAQLPKTESKFKILILNDNTNDLYEILGITETRAAELSKIAVKSIRQFDYLHQSLEWMAPLCNHENELVFTTLMISKVKESMEKEDAMRQIVGKIIGKMGGSED